MIQLKQPSIAVNDRRVRVRYEMWRTWDIERGDTSRQVIINRVRDLARGVPDGKTVKNLVISCHGYPGELELGEGFQEEHLPLFARWRGLFRKIWLECCLVGRNLNTPFQSESGDGRGFCSRLAHITEADVVAATEVQVAHVRTYPFGHISDYEGLYCLWEGGTGRIISRERNRSRWQDSEGNLHGAGETR